MKSIEAKETEAWLIYRADIKEASVVRTEYVEGQMVEEEVEELRTGQTLRIFVNFTYIVEIVL